MPRGAAIPSPRHHPCRIDRLGNSNIGGGSARIRHLVLESATEIWNLQQRYLGECGLAFAGAFPGVGGVGALEQDDLQCGQHGDELAEHFGAGVEFGGVRGAVDVPGVGIPGQHVTELDAVILEQLGLAFSGGVVVFDAKEP